MPKVTVYAFKVPDIREGEHVLAEGMATLETIASLHGVALNGTEILIDDSLLNDRGRYHPDKPNSQAKM